MLRHTQHERVVRSQVQWPEAKSGLSEKLKTLLKSGTCSDSGATENELAKRKHLYFKLEKRTRHRIGREIGHTYTHSLCVSRLQGCRYTNATNHTPPWPDYLVADWTIPPRALSLLFLSFCVCVCVCRLFHGFRQANYRRKKREKIYYDDG